MQKIDYAIVPQKAQSEQHQQLALDLASSLQSGKAKKQIFQPNQISLRNPCKHCGSRVAKTGAGRKPKELSLTCSECKGFIAWLSSNQLKKLAKLGVSADG